MPLAAQQHPNLNYLRTTISLIYLLVYPINTKLDARLNKFYANRINPNWIFHFYQLAYLILFDLLEIEAFEILVVYLYHQATH